MKVSIVSADAQRPTFYKLESDIPGNVVKRDLCAHSLEELYYVEHPAAEKGKVGDREMRDFISERGRNCMWIYLPWRSEALRIPSENDYFKLRTARNRDLIMENEQRAYSKAVVGIAGLSVGSAALATLVASGGPKRMKLADPDTIELSNLNRIRAVLSDAGANKTEVAARAVWEMDPFAELELWPGGLSDTNLKEFTSGLDIFIDEMDDIALKFAARAQCKASNIPVLMATDNGDGVILDVERFDLENDRALFHGKVDPPAHLSSLTRNQFVELSNKIIDVSYFTQRQRSSVESVGVMLSGIPQIATAAALAGAAIAYAVRQIATKKALPSGRYLISLERAFSPEASF